MSDETTSSSQTIDVTDRRPDDGVLRDHMRAALFGEGPKIRTLGRFHIRGELGRGGMGVVLEALDPELDRAVALKLLHPRLDATAQSSLVREARLLAKVVHPKVVHVYEVGWVGEQVFIAMELVRGKTLRQWQKAGDHTWQECLDVYRQAGQGLAAAHAAGVVHRDFKPHNCIRDDSGCVRVLDFGLADHPSTGADTTGGTRAYMAPEQLDGRPCDARADQFSFCAALFEALHGVHPLAGDEARGLRTSLRSRMSRARVPAWLDRALERGLQHDPDLRWPDMNALLHAIRPRRRLRWTVATAVVGVGVGAAAAAMVVGDEPLAQPCRGAQLRADEIWHDTRRDAIEAALLDTGLPMAAKTWERVRDGLDTRMHRWVEAHTAVCRATQVQGDQSVELLDLRMACLDRRLDGVDGLLDVLEHADADVVISAIDAVYGLPSAESCRRLEPQSSAEPPEAAELRGELVRAMAERDAGRPGRALEQLTALRERVAAPGLERLAAELTVRRGEVQMELGAAVDADRTLDAALWQALEIGHDRVAFEAAVAHASVVGVTLVEEQRGLARVRHARALLGRIGAPDDARREAELAAGLVQGRHGRYEDALQSLERAEELVEPGSGEQLEVLRARGAVALWCARFEEAGTPMESYLEAASQVYGPRHPKVAASLNTLAVIEINRGRAGPAEQRARAAVEILREALGEHPRVADSMMNLAGILLMRDEPDYEGSVRLVEDARGIYVRHLGEDSAKVADADLAMAHGLERLGQTERAEQVYRRNIDNQGRLKGEQHTDLRRPLLALGMLLLDTGRAAEAVEPLRRSLELERVLAEAAGGDAVESELVRRTADLLERARRQADSSGSSRRGESGPR